MKVLDWSVLLIFTYVEHANAETPQERLLYSSPMPHITAASGGKLVKAHYVQLNGYLQVRPDEKEELNKLRSEIERCVASRTTSAGLPKSFPDHINPVRMDVYFAPNRTIIYERQILFTMRPIDCALEALDSSSANLHSPLGQCRTNLMLKASDGNCDADGHASAPVPPATRIDPDFLKKLRGQSVDANAANILSRIERSVSSRGQHRKNILGIECDVVPALDDPEGTLCIVTGGSFQPIGTPLSMTLEMHSSILYEMKAVQAKIDTEIDNGAFAPYRRGGFRLTHSARKK